MKVVLVSQLIGSMTDGLHLYTKTPARCRVQNLPNARRTYDTQIDISSNSYTDIDLSATITPKSLSSKIYVITNVQTFVNGTGLIGVGIVRGSTSILQQQGAAGFQDNNGICVALTKLDSPATTNPITYKIQVNKFADSGTLRINQYGGSRITLMEIAG